MAGDDRAFRRVVEENQAFVFALSYRILGNADDAEDIVQETFIRLWKNISKYRREVKLTTWLYKIVTNLCLDLLKSRRFRERNSKSDLVTGSFVADPGTPEKETFRRELQTIIAELTETLTPKQRIVFVLRDLEGLTVQEICAALSMSPGNVKSNLYYARVSMSEKLKKYYQEKGKDFFYEMP